MPNDLVQTPLLVFTNIIFIAFLFFYLRGAFKSGYISKKKEIMSLLLIFVFCMMSFWGADWFGYLTYFKWIKIENADYAPMEDIYVWLMKDVCTEYLHFRAIVWGAGITFFFLTIKNLNINIGIALFFFSCIYLIYFSYARVSLAIAMMTYGYTLACTNDRKRTVRLIGALLIGCSFYFHKSAILGISLILLSLLMKRLIKNGIILYIIAYPLAIIAIASFFNTYLAEIASSEETTWGQYAQASNSYLEAQSGFSGIGTLIQRIVFERTPYYILAYCSYQELRRPSMVHNGLINAFFVLLFVEIATTSLFLFDYGVNTSTIYGRLLRFAQIPACVVLTYLYQNHLQQRQVRVAYTLGISGCAYSLIYSCYNQFF